MNVSVVNPETLSLKDLMANMSELYYLHMEDTLSKPILTPVSIGTLNLLNEDSLLLKIIPGEVEAEPEAEKPKSKPRGWREKRTYAFTGYDPTGAIYVEFRKTGTNDGDIRVNFKDKESAQAYFEYFREQFYTGTTGASVITVSNIYKDLNLVKKDENNPDGWDPTECDDWGWYTIDHGTCRMITEVLKTRNMKMYGFTLKRPTKLYETKKRDA